MDISIFLAQAFGLLYVAFGVAILVRAREFGKLVDDFLHHAYYTYFTGVMLTLAGVLAVLVHNVWDGPAYVIVVTILAWLVLIKGLAYLILPSKVLASWVRWFDNKNWYWISGIATLLVGIYLVVQGFGWA